MITSALKWFGDTDGFLEIIDQRALPEKLVRLQCKDIESVFNSIRTLTIRGAPAIGVAAAYGLVLALQNINKEQTIRKALSVLNQKCKYLAQARPTGVNLFSALDRVRQKAEQFTTLNPTANLQQLKEIVFKEANSIYLEDIEMCRRIGENGERFIKNGACILTHCNAGALATAGEGTALSVLYQAHKKDKKFTVYVDETRPLLQGSRLTAWELKQAGIETVVICDNMAGWLMKQGKINAVITGADRIAANGDAANKIGTYSLSILARQHKIPFYVAAPSSTFDLSIKDGSSIPIEYRPADEVAKIMGKRITPKGVRIENPAFDITPAKNITAIISERGIIEKPNARRIKTHFA
jgi:methylthioribose-1-phosphate isomerase